MIYVLTYSRFGGGNASRSSNETSKRSFRSDHLTHMYVLYKLDGRFVMNIVVLLADADIPEQEHEWGIENVGMVKAVVVHAKR